MGTRMMMRITLLALVVLAATASARINEVWTKEQTEAAGLVHKGSHIISPLPQDYIPDSALPTNFTWCDKDGVNYCTKSSTSTFPSTVVRAGLTGRFPPS